MPYLKVITSMVSIDPTGTEKMTNRFRNKSERVRMPTAIIGPKNR